MTSDEKTMNGNNLLAIIMATRTEAKPFILGLDMKEVAWDTAPLYGGPGILLAVSGIGKARASLTASSILARFAPRAVLNCGAAGALRPGPAVGDVFIINRVSEPDVPHPPGGAAPVHLPEIIPALPTASLATLVQPALSGKQRRAAAHWADLADMEGSAVAGACRSAGTRVYMVKIVSDTSARTAAEVIAGIRATRGTLYDFYRDNIMGRI